MTLGDTCNSARCNEGMNEGSGIRKKNARDDNNGEFVNMENDRIPFLSMIGTLLFLPLFSYLKF